MASKGFLKDKVEKKAWEKIKKELKWDEDRLSYVAKLSRSCENQKKADHQDRYKDIVQTLRDEKGWEPSGRLRLRLFHLWWTLSVLMNLPDRDVIIAW